jgi:hypothetical protein
MREKKLPLVNGISIQHNKRQLNFKGRNQIFGPKPKFSPTYQCYICDKLDHLGFMITQ